MLVPWSGVMVRDRANGREAGEVRQEVILTDVLLLWLWSKRSQEVLVTVTYWKQPDTLKSLMTNQTC